MSEHSPCAGCGATDSYTRACRVPGTDQPPMYVCSYQRGQNRGEFKFECFAKVFKENCLLCGKPHGRSYHQYSGGFEFSFVCEVCTARARLAEGTETIIIGRDILRYEKLIGPLIKALGGQTRDYKTPYNSESSSWMFPADIGYVVSMTKERAAHLREFLQNMREEWDDSVRRARQEGRSLLARLADGEYTVREFDDELARENKPPKKY